jgi:hypothetical protein
LRVNKSITRIHQPSEITEDAAFDREFAALWTCNFSLCSMQLSKSSTSYFTRALCKRNTDLEWRSVHAMIVDIVIGLSPLQLPSYCLLWIIDELPWIEIAHSQYKKITLIDSLLASIRKTQAFVQDDKRRQLGLR